MSYVLPIWLGAVLFAAFLAISFGNWTANRRDTRRGFSPTGDRVMAAWVAEVRRRLPEAWDSLSLTRVGPPSLSRNRARPQPTIVGHGHPVEEGWSWRVNFPGSAGSQDVDPERLAGALNSGKVLVDVVETVRTAPGWANLNVFRTDPLAIPKTAPWEPGSMPSCVPPGTVCLGIRRDGEHVHCQMLVPGGGGMCALIGGRRLSGKSAAMISFLAQMTAWGWADPILVDLVRQGIDIGRFEPLAACPLVTDLSTAIAAVKLARAECNERALRMRARGVRVLDQPTVAEPLIPIFIDEIHSPMSDATFRREMTAFAQEARAMGGLVICATQYPTLESLGGKESGPFRQQLGYRLAFKCSAPADGQLILGSVQDGLGPHLLRTGPGSCIADLDGGGQFSMRTWWLDDAWLDLHIERLVAQRQAA